MLARYRPMLWAISACLSVTSHFFIETAEQIDLVFAERLSSVYPTILQCVIREFRHLKNGSTSVWNPFSNSALSQFFMAALCNRAGHYIFAMWFLSSSFFFFLLFSSPNLSGRRLDVYHTSTHCVALVRVQNAGLKCAARGSLKYRMQKIAIWTPSHNFVGLYLHN